jgi:hypothetical protein
MSAATNNRTRKSQDHFASRALHTPHFALG